MISKNSMCVPLPFILKSGGCFTKFVLPCGKFCYNRVGIKVGFLYWLYGMKNLKEDRHVCQTNH